MIEITFKTLNNPSFRDALVKLANQPGFGTKEAYRIGKIADKVEIEMRSAALTYVKIKDKYGKRGIDGRVLPSPVPPGFVFDNEDDKEKFQVEYEEFLGLTVKIEQEKVKPSSLRKVGLLRDEPSEKPTLTPNEMLALESVVDFDEPDEKPGLALV